MSSPHHPTGPGAPQWREEPGPHPGPNGQPSAGSQYGQGPGNPGPGGQYGQGPGGQYGQGPGPYGPDAQGGQPTPYGSGPGPYGSGPAQHGSGPGPYGSGPGQYGQAPGQYGSGPGPYGSGPGQFGPGPAPQRPRRTGPGLLGPLTLRDLFLLFAGLLALIVLFVPYKNYDIITMSLWSWNIDAMGTFVFVVLAILLIVGAVLMNKLGTGRMRVGSLGLDQFISVLSSVAFAFAFVQLITSAPYWSVGAYLAFFAALIAFFAGVFTMLPFFAAEFAGREDVPAHAKARPVTKAAQHPAPQAHVPGGFDGGYGSGPHPGAQGPQGQGGPGGVGPGQYGQAVPGQDGPSQYGAPQGGYGQPGYDSAQPTWGSDQSAYDAGQQGRPGDQAASGRHAYSDDAGSPFTGGTPRPQASFAPPAEDRSSGTDDASGQPVQSTGSGQTYLGDQHPRDPRHSQSEPTQTFGLGTEPEESAWTSTASAASAASAAEPTPAASQADADDASAARRDGTAGDGSADAAALRANADDTVAISRTVVESGPTSTEEETITSVSERRRGRHSAESTVEAESSANAASPDSDARSGSSTVSQPGTVTSSTVTSADEPGPGPLGVFDGGTKAAASQGTESRSANASPASREGAAEDATSAETTSASTSSANATSADATPVDSATKSSATAEAEETNIRSTEATVVNSEGVVETEPGADPTGREAPESRADDSRSSTERRGVVAASSGVTVASGDDVTTTDAESSTERTAMTGDHASSSPDGDSPDRAAGSADRWSVGDRRPEDQVSTETVGDETVSRETAGEETVQVDAVTTEDSRSSAEPTTERTTPPDSDEPTQYVPMTNYRDSSQERTASTDRDTSDGESSDRSASGSGADRPASSTAETTEEKTVIQAFWFAVPEPREAVDATTGMPVFTIYPGDWFLALEDHGTSFTVRDSDGKEGVLRNLEGIQRG
ncbi:hypothetical protein M3G54_13895 [Brevibacterium casei]|uniref:hypothetical protein n=1 Tax=Brevibacterium casei TaxID=33889 RepID=UPI00223BCFCB|nr:hypothetical protein [Brevibacterium casei]MCT2359465.1 hypothetical protein [Brevibacterium casei]